MKKKLTALFLGLAVTLCMCGCDSENVPDMLIQPFAMMQAFTAEEDVVVRTVDKDIMDKCFDEIRIGPATFALPMNVSDLPEGIVCELIYDGQSRNLYNGMKIITAVLYAGESSQDIGYAEILCTDAENYDDGVIMSLSAFADYASVFLGDISLNMTYDEISEAMGYGGEAGKWCVYVSRDNRSVLFSDYAIEEKEYPDYVCIATDPELYLNDIISF